MNLPVDIVQTFWLRLNKASRCALLREMDVIPANSSLNFTQQRLGLLKVAEERKLTKFRAALKAHLPAGRRGPVPAVSSELKRAAVALAAETGFLFRWQDDANWQPAHLTDDVEIHTDAVVRAGLKAGWIKRFHSNIGGNEFEFAAVTAAGYAALEKRS